MPVRDQNTAALEREADCLRERLTALTDHCLLDQELARTLVENELRYQAIVEDQTELICRFRPSGDLTFVNPAYCKYYDAPEREILRGRFLDKAHPEDREPVAKRLACLGKVKPVVRIQLRALCPRNKIRWQEWALRAILTPTGEIMELQGVGRDVTDMKSAMRYLQGAEKKYRTIFNNAPLGVYRSTGDGKLLEANPAMAAMLGYDRPAALVKAVRDLGAEIYAQPERRAWITAQAREGDRLCVADAVLRRKDGSLFTARIYMSAVRDEDGTPLFFEGLIDDVTERNRMEEELRRSERTASALLNASMDAAYLLDAEGFVLAANKQGAERFGLTRTEIAGKSIASLLPWEVFENRMEKIRRVFEEKKPIRYVDERRSGVYDIQITPVFEDKDMVDKAALFLRDITEQTRLARLREEVERFTRHDMKTPLIGIAGFADLLLAGDNLTDKQREYLGYIKTSGEKLLDFMQKSLDLFRMEQRAYELNPVRFDFSRCLRRILLNLRGVALSKDLNVRTLCDGRPAGPETPIPMYGEEGHLENLFANLVKNAMEASPKGAAVTIAVTGNAGVKEIVIHNQGAIPKKIRDDFFGRYVTCGKCGGAGLGAYIARLIARNHNGDVAMRTSEAEGTFLTVTLPFPDPESAA